MASTEDTQSSATNTDDDNNNTNTATAENDDSSVSPASISITPTEHQPTPALSDDDAPNVVSDDSDSSQEEAVEVEVAANPEVDSNEDHHNHPPQDEGEEVVITSSSSPNIMTEQIQEELGEYAVSEEDLLLMNAIYASLASTTADDTTNNNATAAAPEDPLLVSNDSAEGTNNVTAATTTATTPAEIGDDNEDAAAANMNNNDNSDEASQSSREEEEEEEDDDNSDEEESEEEESEESEEEEEEEDSEEDSEDEDDSVRTFDWQRNTTTSGTGDDSSKPYFSSRQFQNDLMDAKFPVLRNDDGAIVALGDEWDSFLYCGRRLGRTAIPNSDGRCGPNNGPQCESCRRLQTHKKYKILEIIFPSLPKTFLTAALRKRGGNAFAACQFLESSCKDIPRVPSTVAFPGSRPDGIPEPCYPVKDEDAQNVVSFFDDNITIETAKMALRKNEHNLEQAVTYILDKSPEQLAVETCQDVERVKEYEDAVLQFQLNRRETIQQVAMKLADNSFISPSLRQELEALVPEMDMNQVLSSAMEDGHGMVTPSSANESSVKCTVCALEIGTDVHAGSHYCSQCNHCEGCIQTKVVYKCPRMGNGGHLHPCALSQMKIGPDRKGYICDIDGKGCLHSENHNLSYYCQECNFDVCAVCISQPAPVYYHRRLGRLVQFSEEEEDEDVYSDDDVEDSEEQEEEEQAEATPDEQPRPELQPEEEANVAAEAEQAGEATEGVASNSSPEPPVVAADGQTNDDDEVPPESPVEISPVETQATDTTQADQAPAIIASEENSVEPDTSPRPAEVIDESSSTPAQANDLPGDSSQATPSATDPTTPPSAVLQEEVQDRQDETVPEESIVPAAEPSGNVEVVLAPTPPTDSSSEVLPTSPVEEAPDQQETVPDPTMTPAPAAGGSTATSGGLGFTFGAPAAAAADPSENVGESESAQVPATTEEATGPSPEIQNEGEPASEEGNETEATANAEGNDDASGGRPTTEDPKEEEAVPPTFDLHERIAASRWGADAREEDNQVEIIIGAGDVRTMERRLKRKQSSDDNDAPAMRHNRPETLLTSKYATALESYVCKECPAASNIHHVESLLHIAQGNEKCCPSEAVCQAVSAGKMGIAATCLLAPMYGSKRKKASSSAAGEMRCFCGDIIDSKTAPDGAVGCLNGHALHPSCAADYLLSGGNCPTCREPLFFPKVGKDEATAAEEYLEIELQRRRKEEEEAIRKEQLANGQVFNVNDIVRISSDEALCKQELMANPGKTGWTSEMDSFCGAIGRVTEVEEGKVKIKNKELQHTFFMPETVILCNSCSEQVGSKDGQPVSEEESNKGLCIFCGHCSSCCLKGDDPTCEKSSIKLNWTPSTVSLIGRASSAALWDKSLVDKDLATAAAAEQHIIRLRAEMNAVTTARATVQDALGNMKGAPSIKALDGLKEAVSAFDFERARHLLGLMNHWGDGPVMLKEKKAVMETLRKGDIDTAARKIRHHNAALVEDDAKWRYAASDKHEYVVESWAKVHLVAWPALSAPRTGYCLGPKVRFQSKQEVLGADGNIWLLVDESSLILPQFVNGKPVVADPKDPYAYKNLVGCQVTPGPNWTNDSIAADEIGTITAVSGSSIRVKFSRSDSHSWHYPSDYPSGDSGPMNLLFANPPAPQGWLCMTPRQVPVVRRGRDALQCFSCGDGLISEETSAHESIRIVKKEEEINVGQTLLVAATLEPVEVKSVENDYIHCSFANQDSVHSICVKFRRDDLLHPCSPTENSEETVAIDGRERGRQDLFMKHGSIPDAKAAWNSAKSSSNNSNGNPSETTELLTTNYASCVKGHLLHARCFQEALIAGKKCPVSGCNEPLWAPKVRRLQRDDDACCGGNSEDADGEVQDANVSGMDAVARARNENEEVDYHQDRELKMCPACFSGPLLNQNCNDMEAHHGQCVHHAFGNDDEDPCYFCADAKAISSSLMQLSGDKKVVDVLPRCPTHDCVIMFSGCMVCGHLFNETSWADLPKWDPCAKALLDVDRKKRKAAAALVTEITREAALLEYERDAVHNLWARKEEKATMELIPPLPPPAMGFSDAISDSDSDSDEESDY